jgi:hypothetical protein
VTDSRRVGFLWCGLAVAFSPSLYNLGESLWEAPWQRYVLFSVLLIALLVRNQPNPNPLKRRPGVGTGLLLFGLISQLFGIAAGSWSIARWGLPLAVLGVSLIVGRPTPSFLVLAFGVIPIPDFVVHATSPWLESALATTCATWLPRHSCSAT